MRRIAICATVLVAVVPVCFPAIAGPLHDAAASGDAATVESLVAAGAVLEEKDAGQRTALYRAVDAGHPEVVRVLLAKGADPNTPDLTGVSALAVASMKGDADTVGLLLEHGADPNAADKDGGRPLDDAVRMGYDAVVEKLRAAGAECGTNHYYSKVCLESR